MNTIIAGEEAALLFQVQHNGKPVSVTGDLRAAVYTADGAKKIIDDRDVFDDEAGANWPAGIVAVKLDSADTSLLGVGDAMLVLLGGGFGVKRFRVTVETIQEPTRTSLFIKDLIVQELREDRLMAASAGAFQNIEVSDDYLWQKIRAAESEISHTLRVPLVPTRFFSKAPTPAEIAALDGMAWDIDPAYDYSPDMFQFEKWGYFITRQRPIISVERMRFAYPSVDTGFMDIPKDWIRTDARYGHIRLVPSSPTVFITMNTFIMNALAGSRSIPFMIQLEYTAGLTDVQNKYPELLDAIKKKAVLKVIADAFLPQSGSISSDGLSQSMSFDVSKYHESIDAILNGEKGSNGGLMAKIHGVRLVVC